MIKKGKVLAIDYGKKRIGLASGDFETKIAFPRMVLGNTSDVFGELLRICEEIDVKLILVGFPLNIYESQKENPILKEVLKFVDELKGKLSGIPVELYDERLSSFEAKQMTGKSGYKKNERLDAHAAQIVLQRFFDEL